jgi:hypothetical protein
MNQEKLKTINDPKEVLQSLNSLCHEKLSGLIKIQAQTKLMVRFNLDNLILTSPPYLHVKNISTKGMEYLTAGLAVQVEVIGLKQRVVFLSQIMSTEHDSALLTIPSYINVHERRINTRYPTGREMAAFLNIKDFAVDGNDITHPPIFGLYKPLSSWVLVRNISIGGAMIETNFPGIHDFLGEKKGWNAGQLILPRMTSPQISFEVRWQKRLRETLAMDDNATRSQLKFQSGIRFGETPEGFIDLITLFTNKLSVATAI